MSHFFHQQRDGDNFPSTLQAITILSASSWHRNYLAFDITANNTWSTSHFYLSCCYSFCHRSFVNYGSAGTTKNKLLDDYYKYLTKITPSLHFLQSLQYSLLLFGSTHWCLRQFYYFGAKLNASHQSFMAILPFIYFMLKNCTSANESIQQCRHTPWQPSTITSSFYNAIIAAAKLSVCCK